MVVGAPGQGVNAGLKVCSLVAGMLAGDSIDDMGLLRHGGTGKLFSTAYAPSTLGSFLRAFTFGHVRQLDAVASRLLAGLAGQGPLLAVRSAEEFVFLDVDDTIIEVHGYQKQGPGYWLWQHAWERLHTSVNASPATV